MVTREAGEPADTDLVRRALAGDRDAFAAIYGRYQAVVYRFARAMSGSAAVAEDVTQEVFVALMRDLHRYEPQRAGLATYLYGVARNLSRGRLRKEQRFVALEAAAAGVADPIGPSDPAARFAQSEEVARVRTALVAVPSRYREVVILCDLHGLSYAEAAAVVRVPVGTVRSRLHRGRALLVAQLRAGETRSSVHATIARCLA